MSQKYFVQLKIGSKTYKDKVSIERCFDVADFKEEIKKKFPALLHSYDTAQLTLYEPYGTTEIDPETSIEELFVTTGKPYIVKVEENPSQRSNISSTRHQDYKHSKAVHSSRSYLTSIAVELDKIYPVSCYMDKRKKITFGHILEEAYHINPEPKLEYRNKYQKKLNDFYSAKEWNFLEDLNDIVNPLLHSSLDIGSDGKSIVILPIEISHLGPTCQRIAKRTNVVSDVNDLIVKNEGSVSGGSPDSEKKV